MNHKLLGTALAFGIVGIGNAQGFIQIANYNLGAFGTNQTANDIAFDGTDLYVVSSNNLGGTSTATSTVSIRRVADVLNPAGQVGSNVLTRSDVYNSRASRVAISGSSLYFGFGLGAGIGTIGQGIEKYSISGGSLTIDTSFGGDGVVQTAAELNPTGSGISNPTRIDSFAIDTDGNLVATAFGSGAFFKVDSATGTALSPIKTVAGAVPSTSWRDVAVGQNGDLFARVPTSGTPPNNQASLVRYSRASSVTFNNTPTVLGTALGASYQTTLATLNNVGPSGIWSFVAGNNISTNQVNWYLQDGSVGGVLTGTENGLGSAFTSNNLSFTTGQVGGRNFLFVANSANNVRVYEMVPEPATMAALGLGVLGLLKRRKKA